MLDDLLLRFPASLLDLLGLDGLGAKTVKRLYEEFGIARVADLDQALRDGRLNDAPHIGSKTLEKWRRSVLRARRSRRPLATALAVARDAMSYLSGSGLPLQRLVYAGSLRRAEPLVGDVDLICTTSDARAVIADGPTKASIWTHDGLQIDLRVLPDDRFGNLCMYTAGIAYWRRRN